MPDEVVAAIQPAMQPLSLGKDEHWFAAGELCTHAAFIANGCMRYYYLDAAGLEHTGQFFFEGTWIGDYGSFYSGQPSQKSFQALEPTTLLLVSKHDLEALYEQYPQWQRFGRKMAEYIVVAAQERTESLLRESLEHRYERLVKTRPKVLARVPQHLIASYLGVKPESLSRLRSRLARTKA